jgi:hypothetical protein
LDYILSLYSITGSQHNWDVLLKNYKKITKKRMKSNQKSTEILRELRTLSITIKLVIKEGHSTLSVMNFKYFLICLIFR